MLNQPFKALAQDATSGPVVVLLVHDGLCEAIIIPDPVKPEQQVTLPKDLLENVEELSKQVLADNLRLGLALPDIHELHGDLESVNSCNISSGKVGVTLLMFD